MTCDESALFCDDVRASEWVAIYSDIVKSKWRRHNDTIYEWQYIIRGNFEHYKTFVTSWESLGNVRVIDKTIKQGLRHSMMS